ncbi:MULTISPECIES: arylamine N-acetyltransferase [Sorangium]|uniref:N-hydroxyarylamine O-acetyltransferase n=1 Tax=Sorangium cellulosum TaxID=56 RepID=A0A4P2QWC0_SORCE|nr:MULTISPECIES: arylamine N-acetyltransferase [Sorangium]AUX34770.1 N-hydroxyarylamine O-acetyltransferase [Sorangium cellulosum]WCQ94081.1 Arylamine N-acetyltransferase [Sorangium sp. Soce836]
MHPSAHDTASLDLDAYLARIGYRGALAATREVLDALHSAHVYSIPFENLDVLLGRPIRIDLASVQSKLVKARRGGYCFEQNTLFVAALRRIGFKVTTLLARVRFQRSEVGPRTHMLSLVELPEGPFIADVGFGGPGLTQPIRLVEGESQAQAHDVVGLRREGHVWVLESRGREPWQDLYAFTLEEHFPVDYEAANHYTSTHPDSLFVSNVLAALASPEARLTLRNRQLGVFRGGRFERFGDLGDDELLDVLKSRFGLELPAGARLSCAGLNG